MSLSRWLLVLPFVPLGAFAATVAGQTGAGTDAPPAAPLSAVRFLPLQEGARWIHLVRHQTGDAPATTQRITLVDEGAFALPSGLPVHQVRVEPDQAGSRPSYEYWSVRGDAVECHLSTDPMQRGSIDLAAAPSRLLAGPVGEQATWRWEGRCDQAVDPTGGTWMHRAELIAASTPIEVAAGKFEVAHVRIVSEREGAAPSTREIWFARDVGIVKDELRNAATSTSRELVLFTPGRAAAREREQRVRDFLTHAKAGAPWHWPWIGWIDAAPEAMLLRGRIAIVKEGGQSRCLYVDDQDVHPFEPREADRVTAAAKAAFGSARPSAGVALEPLAMLLARAHAERCDLGNVRPAAMTLVPKRLTPLASGDRRAAVEVVGGGPDGTQRRVAVWLTVGRRSSIVIATDAAEPPADR